ncbi:WD repeat and SOCS box-containing protein 1 isoform X1 [Ciona intestinalis]
MVNFNSAKQIKFSADFDKEIASDVTELPSIYSGVSRWKPGRESKCCAFSSDGSKFAWCNGHGFVKVVKCNSGEDITTEEITSRGDSANVRLLDCGKNVVSMEFAPKLPSFQNKVDSTSLLAIGLERGSIKIWNVDTGDMVYTLADHTQSVTGLTFATKGEPLMISCSEDSTMKVWDLGEDGNMSLTIKGHNSPIQYLALSPNDPSILASVGMGKAVYLWKLPHKRSYEKLRLLRGHNNDVVSCSWSPDGALLATASHDTTVIVWEPFSGEQILVLGHLFPMPSPIYVGGSNGAWVKSVCFSKDGTKIATVCEDNRIRVWKPWLQDTPMLENTILKEGYQCRISPDGCIIAVGKQDGSVTMIKDSSTEVNSLLHLSRLAVRKSFSLSLLQTIALPPPIMEYLAYRPSIA